MMSGVGLATVAGVPLGAFAGQHVGWRGAFWGLAVLAVAAALLISRFVPTGEKPGNTSVTSQAGVLRSSRRSACSPFCPPGSSEPNALSR
jgi:predicted MFS family arabinose efflux permease